MTVPVIVLYVALFMDLHKLFITHFDVIPYDDDVYAVYVIVSRTVGLLVGSLPSQL